MEKKKFWQHTWLMWVTFFILPPIGIVLMWINKKFNKAVRIILSVVFGIYTIIFLSVIFSGGSGTKENEDVGVNITNEQTENSNEVIGTEQTNTDEPGEAIEGMRPNHKQAMGTLKLTVADSFAPNYTVEYVNDEKDVEITLWFEDFTKEQCEKEEKQTIDELISTYETLCKEYENYWNDEGYKYGTVTITIVDVNNKDTVLFSFYSGVCDYAITE